jgi:hypothetical protein
MELQNYHTQTNDKLKSTFEELNRVKLGRGTVVD